MDQRMTVSQLFTDTIRYLVAKPVSRLHRGPAGDHQMHVDMPDMS